MSPVTKVVITGAAGNLGSKLRRHFEQLGWSLALLDVSNAGDAAIEVADLAHWDERWVGRFAEADAVVHLAGDPSPSASWAAIQRLNIDLLFNVYEAAARQGARRLIFASSNWVVAGERFGEGPLREDAAPSPVNAYGASKLVGERLGRSYSERGSLSVICFRIGYCQRGVNEPGPRMGYGLWGQRMWLSDRDLCQGFEKAVLAPAQLRFAVLNLMSRNDGMRWDLDAARKSIGYVPLDRFTPIETDALKTQAAAAANAHVLATAANAFIQGQRW
ncbi:MAG: NAD(P)-dependent oxidoreductase [Proteobacteria bacterium]|nr:NAD(P)-dependent oxidoreductase [Pseudomonadota bacterium]MBI3499257.1 NAD(P)-dependent oxidoreductase [Pseudomonadota bacterium]